jgi:hypothetical protein
MILTGFREMGAGSSEMGDGSGEMGVSIQNLKSKISLALSSTN